jgi:hypothetical protein
LPTYDGWDYVRCDPMPAAACPQTVEIDSVATLQTTIEATVSDLWSTGNGWNTEHIAISPDLIIQTTLTLDSSNMASLGAGIGCTQPEPDCEPIRYGNPGGAEGPPRAGVSFLGDVFGYCQTDPCIQQAYPAMQIAAGTTVRLAFKRYLNGGLPSFPMVEVYPPCPDSCGQDMYRCPFDGRCYTAGETMCRTCKAAPPNRCACIKPVGGQMPEDSLCTYIDPANQDVAVSGACVAGVCIPTP